MQLPHDKPAGPEFTGEKGLAAVRRLVDSQDRRVRELEAIVADLWAKNGRLHELGQKHIDHLEGRNQELENRNRELSALVSSGTELVKLLFARIFRGRGSAKPPEQPRDL
jgi:hypothetical protein